MSTSPEVLVLTDQPQLRSELQAAFHLLGDKGPRLRFAADRHQLFEAIRTRAPLLALVEFSADPRELMKLARDLLEGSSSVPLAAIIRPQGFGDDVSEGAVIIDAMRSGVRDFLRRPISTSEVRRLIDQMTADQGALGIRPGESGRVVSFISNKGGVGKSTLAVNTAVLLARRRPGRVLLIDASLQLGVASALLDLAPATTLTDAARERDRLDVTMLRQLTTPHASGLHLLAAPADAVEAMEVDDLLMTRIITLARQSFEFIVIDTFPMFDRVIVAALDLSDRAYIVIENVVPTLLGATRLLDVLGRISFPPERQSIIVNRLQRVTGCLPLADIAARLGHSIDHVFPFDKRVMEAANTGEPVALRSFVFSGYARSLQRLADDVERLTLAGSASATNGRAAHHNVPEAAPARPDIVATAAEVVEEQR